MKQLKYITLAITLLIFSSFLQSCLDDNEPSDSLVISTIIVPVEGGKDYYFNLDDGSNMYPGDTRKLAPFELKDGQRAFVIFKELDEKIAGYDYNVEVKKVEPILTKDIIELTTENTVEIGDDCINTTHMWIAQGYLTIEFQYLGTHNKDKMHFLNLVINETATEKENDEYINLEFRHNAEGDVPNRLGEGYVSFKLKNIKSQIEGKKGLKIRVNTIYDGEKFYNIDFPSSHKAR